MTDRIALKGLKAVGYHGVFDHERRDGQEFTVDVMLHVDVAAAAMSDDLSDTVDYGTIALAVHDIVTGEPLNLIETLASRIADACLVDPRVSHVEVTVHKPFAPITVAFSDVTVTVARGRTGHDG